jgi:hypothetical protein
LGSGRLEGAPRAPCGVALAADQDVPPAAKPGGARIKGQVANGHLKSLSSNSAERIVRRLKRDRPDIAEALARGAAIRPAPS